MDNHCMILNKLYSTLHSLDQKTCMRKRYANEDHQLSLQELFDLEI